MTIGNSFLLSLAHFVGKDFHEDSECSGPGHRGADSLEEPEEVAEADEGADVFEAREEGEEETGSSLHHGTNVKTRLRSYPRTIFAKNGTARKEKKLKHYLY